jgi:hypothetical protein
MTARFFLDETDLLLAKKLAELRPGDVVFPGHRDLPEVPRGTLDPDWLPEIGRRRLVIITRDRKIRGKPVEQALWVQYRLRGFVLTGKSSQSTDQSLGVIGKQWAKIEEHLVIRRDGPWMYALHSGGIREIPLGSHR